MAIGKNVQQFMIDDVSAGCNYADDLKALKKNQSPDSMNMEFYNGRIRKRRGETAFTTAPTGQGGIDSYTKLLLHMDGADASTTFTDSELTPKAVTANAAAQLAIAQKKFGTASGSFPSTGIDGYTKLMLHCDGIDGSTTITDSEITPKTVTAVGNAEISTTVSKFGGASAYFNQGIDSYTVLMLHCDGTNGSTTFTDSASGAKTVTALGDAQVSTASPKFGTGSLLLDGTGDYLTVPSSGDFDMGSGDFTYECWVKTATTGASQYFFHRREPVLNNDQVYFVIGADDKLAFNMQDGGATNLASYVTANVINTGDNVWHHYALVRSGTNIYMFKDGVSLSLTAVIPISTHAMATGTGVLSIGASATGGSLLNGRMDEIRISKGIARWTSNFQAALTPYSSGDYLTTADDGDWAFGTGDFTIDFWVNFTTVVGDHRIYNQQPDGTVAIYLTQTSTNLDFTIYNGGVLVELTTVSLGLTAGTWYHVAVVRYGNIFTLYVNGVSQASSTASITAPNIASPLQIGGRIYSGDLYFNGFIDEFRVSKGIARWMTTFTPPTAAYASPGYLSLADSNDWAFGTGDFTIDFWMYPSILSGLQAVYSQDDTVGTNQIMFFLNGTGYRFSAIVAGVQVALYDVASGLFSTGTWQHVAIVRSGTTFSIFVNGAVTAPTVTTALGSSALPDVAQALEIARQSTGGGQSYFNGYLDEYRVSKGIARWTTDFTPPALSYDAFNASVPLVGFSVIDYIDTSSNHKQVAHFGTNVYSYDRMSNTKTALRLGAPYARSFNAKISAYLIQTYNDYSLPYYWDGSASSMALVSVNAPGFKRSIEYQGYMIGMNISSAKTRCYYQSTSNLLGGGAAYTDYFTLTPAPNDDEITDPFLLNGRLYAGTKYSIFRISFVGGVTVFEFKQVISNTGIVPGTVQTVITKEFGQVVLFLGTDKRMYLFDGANVKAISDLFYNHNQETPISLDLIDDNYKENSFAVYDFTTRIYRLFITKQSSSKNYYAMNVDVDTFAYYPFDNMQFCSGTIGYDGLLKPFLVCADYTGVLHKMFLNTNTDNGTAINEYYKSPLVSKIPSAIKKGDTISLDLIPSSSANLVVEDQIDFARVWKFRQNVPLSGSRDKFLGQSFVLGSSVLGSMFELLTSSIAINASFNNYRFKLYSDTPTAEAWELYDINVNQDVLKIGKAEAQQ